MKTKNIVTLLVGFITLFANNTHAEYQSRHGILDHYQYAGFFFTFSTDDTTYAKVQGSISETQIYNNIPSEMEYFGHTYTIKKIDSDAFHQVTTSNIRNFIIPDSVVSIGGNLFRNYVFDTITICCSNMHNLQSKNAIGAKNVLILNTDFPISDNYDYNYKVDRTWGAQKIITGSRVNRIPGWFAYPGSRETNRRLRTVFLSDSIKSIGEYAFYNCVCLHSITLGKNINSIGQHAFTGCKSLDTIVWNVKTYRDISNIWGGASDPFSYSTTTTGENLRPNIKSFTFGTEVEYIPRLLCHGMGIESISIPYSVTAIGDVAFYNCKSLKSIYNYSPVPLVIDSSVFEGVDKTQCTLYVPQGTVAAYQVADVWKDFIIIGSLTDFSPLLNYISLASSYLETISGQEEYFDIADALNEAILNAQNVAKSLTSTTTQVSQAALNLETALQEAQSSIQIINTTLFENRKNMAINYCDSIMNTEESPVCIQLINDALSTIQDLSYNEEISLTENLTFIEDLVKSLNDNIAEQHKQEQLALDKEKFAEYKGMAIDSCFNLLLEQDSEIVVQLITDATTEIDGMQYDEELTYPQNQAKIDEIISKLIKNINTQRQKEDIHKVNQPVMIQKVIYGGHIFIIRGKKMYNAQGQEINMDIK